MWNKYSIARDLMLKQTSSEDAPWTVIDANDKKLTHLNIIRDLLSRVKYPGKDQQILKVDSAIVLPCTVKSKKLPKLAK
jgi:hypothetical protein